MFDFLSPQPSHPTCLPPSPLSSAARSASSGTTSPGTLGCPEVDMSAKAITFVAVRSLPKSTPHGLLMVLAPHSAPKPRPSCYIPQGVEEITASRSARRLRAEHCSPTRPHEACATCQTPTPRFGDPGCVCKTGSSGAGLPPAAHAATPYRPAAPLPGPHGSVSAARMAHLSDEKASRKSSAGTYGGPTDLIGDTAKARVGRGGRGAPRGMLGAGERGSACRA